MKHFKFMAALLAGLMPCPVTSAHDHLAVGVAQLNGSNLPLVGSPLVLTGPPISGNVSTTVYHMLPRPTGQKYGGYYTLDEQVRTLFPNDYFTLIALSDGQTVLDGLYHASTGAYIWAEITTVAGPPGGHFGFWDENQASYRTTPNISFTTNTATGNYKFEISEPISFPSAPTGAITESPTFLHYIINSSTTGLVIANDEDPYGHIHNRGFTVDKPGDYYVGFTFYDMSKNGPGGGPLHAKSQTYYFHFQAGPEFIPTPTISGNNVVLTWPSQMGIGSTQTGVTFTVQRSLDLTGWTTLGTVVGTTGNTATFTHTSGFSASSKGFYRLQYSWSAP